MGRSTEYYRTHPEARKKKAKKDKEIKQNAGNLVVKTTKRTRRRVRAGGKERIVLIPRTVLGINQ